MPKITNTTLIAQAKPLCGRCKKENRNWNWHDQAILTVRFILGETCPELLGPDYAQTRADLVALVEKFGYPKNFQNSYLALTTDDAGEPLMKKIGGGDSAESKPNTDEFV